MLDGRSYGKTAAGISPQERPAFRAVQVMNAAAHVGARAKTLASKMNLFTRQAEEVQAEILAMGSVSEAVARRSLSIGVMGCVVLLICMAGEFVIAHWTIEHFGLGLWEAYLLAAAIVLLSVEAVDLYLGALRRKYPSLEADYFLIFGCIGFVLLLVLIYFLADIRAALYHTLTAISSSDSLEETISQAEAFRGKDTKEFVWLMITLTALLVIVGGAIFHDVKHRLPFSMACIRAYRRLRHTEAQMLSTAEEMAFLDAQVPQFEADFDAGLAEELQRREAQKHAPEPEVTVKERVSLSSVLGRLGPVIVSPLALALCALLLLLLWFRPASGADHIVFLDFSGSVAVKDYSGKNTEFARNAAAVEGYLRNRLSPGDLIKVFGITERSFERPYVLINDRVSPHKGSFGEGLAREKLRLLKQWQGLKLEPNAKATDIFGAVGLAAIHFSQGSREKNLVFFSDMRQCSALLTLEKPSRFKAEALVGEVEQKGFVFKLPGVRVHCLGVHSAGKAPGYWHDLKAFWALYFERAGAKLLTFSMERRFTDE